MEKLPDRWVPIGETGFEVGITPEYAEGNVRLWIRKPGYLPEKLSLLGKSQTNWQWVELIWKGMVGLLFNDLKGVIDKTVEVLRTETGTSES